MDSGVDVGPASAVKAGAAARLGLAAAPPQRLNESQIEAIADGLNSLLALLRAADPRDKAELYARIGLRMTYQPGRETIKAVRHAGAAVVVTSMAPPTACRTLSATRTARSSPWAIATWTWSPLSSMRSTRVPVCTLMPRRRSVVVQRRLPRPPAAACDPGTPRW